VLEIEMSTIWDIFSRLLSLRLCLLAAMLLLGSW